MKSLVDAHISASHRASRAPGAINLRRTESEPRRVACKRRETLGLWRGVVSTYYPPASIPLLTPPTGSAVVCFEKTANEGEPRIQVLGLHHEVRYLSKYQYLPPLALGHCS
ncbi:hypothetical protein C8R44DRAFT_987859 [Mycena epipterygia]|nr:hypothetical protein C8R44DRAFT_987859 [Mycena epipterygia]